MARLRYRLFVHFLLVIMNVVLFFAAGMHHQGVFRVSGSQHEINEFKNEFERGLLIEPLTTDLKHYICHFDLICFLIRESPCRTVEHTLRETKMIDRFVYSIRERLGWSYFCLDRELRSFISRRFVLFR